MRSFLATSILLICAVLASCFALSSKQEGLTVEEYQKKISVKDKPVLVYFHADWCVPCVKLKPVMDQLEAEQKDKVLILRLDVDENPLVSQYLEINTLPLFIIYKNGQSVWQNNSSMTKEELTDKLNRYK